MEFETPGGAAREGRMKTDEQVLKEWMSDRIMFTIGRRKSFTQYEFAAVTDTLCNKRLVDINRYVVKHGAFKFAVRASRLTLRMDSISTGATFPKLDHITAALNSPEHEHLRDPRKLARFESASELYNYLQNADNKLGIMRIGVPIQVVQPAEHIKIKVVISAAPKKRER